MLLVVSPVVIASCSAIGGSPQPGPLATYPKSNSGMDARREGMLTVQDNCVAIALPGGTLVVPVFPEGDASWSDGVLSWGGDRFTEGDWIVVGGGLMHSTGLASAYIPVGCSGLSAFAVAPDWSRPQAGAGGALENPSRDA